MICLMNSKEQVTFQKFIGRKGINNFVIGEDMPKTSFQRRYGYNEFLVMCFVLNNALTTIMDLINRVFYNYLDSLVITLYYYKSENEYMDHFRIVFHVLK